MPNKQQDKEVKNINQQLDNHNFLPRYKQVEKFFDSWMQWYDFCFNSKKPIFEILTEEYLNALTNYCAKRIERYGASTKNPLLILEVGAGSGRLSYFLQKKLNELISGMVKVVATDSGKLNIKPEFAVEKATCKQALKKYQPDIVLCSWMPYQIDFSADFRQTDSVKEYILIGETDGGCCGDDWNTWGYLSSSKDNQKNKTENLTPYQADGFIRKDLVELSRFQICRTDFPGMGIRHSRTVFYQKIIKFKNSGKSVIA